MREIRSTNDDWPIEDWELEFDYRFGDNFVYWQELAVEISYGDPDWTGMRKFIGQCIKKARAAGALGEEVGVTTQEVTQQ